MTAGDCDGGSLEPDSSWGPVKECALPVMCSALAVDFVHIWVCRSQSKHHLARHASTSEACTAYMHEVTPAGVYMYTPASKGPCTNCMLAAW